MNAIIPRSQHLTQTVVSAVWKAKAGAFMVLGRTSGPLPKSGAARAAAALGTVGVFRAESWRTDETDGHGFLAVIRMPDRADLTEEAELALRGARTNDRDVRMRLRPASSEVVFGQQVASQAGAHAALLAHFMLDVMRSDDGSDMSRPHAVLGSFLKSAARKDGCVELILRTPNHCLVLQGWGTRLSGTLDIVTTVPTVQRHRADAGEFDRSDVSAPATGSVFVLPPEAESAFVSLDEIYLLSETELLSRNIVEPRVLNPETSLGQLRHLFPRLLCRPSLQASLRAALQPQFRGVDTVNNATHPVRAAIDIAVDGGVAGIYLSGWIFDPADSIAEIAFCTTGYGIDVGRKMVRIRRDDVSEAFKADPRFVPRTTQESGFAVAIAQTGEADPQPHLRFTFRDGDMAFLPIAFTSANAPATRQALLGSVDLHKPSGVPLVERHLAPFMSRLSAPLLDPGLIVLPGPLDRPHALVVPLLCSALPRAVIASFLHDPILPNEQLILVCGPTWSHLEMDALADLVRFYRLPTTIIAATTARSAVTALLAASAASAAETFLLLEPTTVGQSANWRRELHRAQPEAAVVCPTILYEDRSIQYAGSRELVVLEEAPFARTHTRLAGLAASYAVGRSTAPMTGGSMACCLFHRAALPVLEHSAKFLTPSGQEAISFHALHDAGLRCAWAADVQVSAADQDVFGGSVAALVDGWMLRQAWKDLPCAF